MKDDEGGSKSKVRDVWKDKVWRCGRWRWKMTEDCEKWWKMTKNKRMIKMRMRVVQKMMRTIQYMIWWNQNQSKSNMAKWCQMWWRTLENAMKIKYTASKFTGNYQSGPSGSNRQKSAGNLSVRVESRLEWLDYRTPSCTVAKAKLTWKWRKWRRVQRAQHFVVVHHHSLSIWLRIAFGSLLTKYAAHLLLC